MYMEFREKVLKSHFHLFFIAVADIKLICELSQSLQALSQTRTYEYVLASYIYPQIIFMVSVCNSVRMHWFR